MQNKIKDKFVICTGCNTKHTINYIQGQVAKVVKCTKCGKITSYKLSREHIKIK
jgi:Zn ribbon nucleic-acid-binding protein